MKKKVWIDVLTPKQAMLLGSIAIKLRQNNYDVILTTRKYDYTQAILNSLGLRYISVGGYGNTLVEKLIEEINRMKNLIEILNEGFDVAIAYPNPSAARISFGLAKPYIALTDSPHSEVVSRLSLPLASYVIFSKCIPEHSIEVFTYRKSVKLIQYNGVDEVEWLKDVEPSIEYVKSLGLEPYNYVVARPPEVKASYYHYADVLGLFKAIIDKVLDLKLQVLYLPRYEDDVLIDYLLKTKSGVIIPSRDHGVIGYNVVYYAVAVVTGGGTIAREAALLGTQGVSLFPGNLYVDKCVEDWGLPLSKCRNVDECLKIIINSIKDPEKYKSVAKSVLKSLEKPSSVVIEVLKEVEGN